jgi:chitinase
MMRGIRRLVVYTAVSGLLAAGAVTASMGVAQANFAGLCDGNSGDNFACTLTTSSNIASPSSISVAVTAKGTEEVAINWKVTCTDNSGTASTMGGVTASVTSSASITEGLTPLPATADGQCSVTAALKLPQLGTSGFVASTYTAELEYQPAVSPTPTPTPSSTSPSSAPVHQVKGFDGKCLDDKGNSSSNRAVVVIWSCSGSDPAENWQYSSSEFIHNGKCLNDQGNGGIRSKVILWTCNGASNEKWSELANGELKLQSHGGTLCLDDPRSSTKNGTQLIVYTCADAANQKWSMP